MKTFRVPLVEIVFHIYCGEDDWERFKRASIKGGANRESRDAPCPKKNAGRAFGSWMWVWDPSDQAVLIHELSHFIDDLMGLIKSTDTEFRAYCTEWVMDTVLTWAGKQQ